MKQSLKKCKCLLTPPWWVILLSVAVSSALLLGVFFYEMQEHWAAYVTYAFSAYTLTVVVLAFVRSFGAMKQGVRSFVDHTPLLQRYFSDPAFRVRASLYLSVLFNILYAVMKFSYGLYYRSFWFGALAVYYFLLAVMRFFLLYHAARNEFGTNPAAEWKRYLWCGIFLLLMNLALAGVVGLVVYRNEGFEYAGYLIYIMAVYAFSKVGTAVKSIVKYRAYHSPVMSAAKVISLVSAMVSMLSLETAMLAEFNDNTEPELFRRLMTGCTGGVVCLLVFTLAVVMITRAAKNLKLRKVA